MKIKSALFGVAVAASLLSATAALADSSKHSWPLTALTKEEREARLRYLIKPQQFQLRREDKNIEPGTCDKIFKKLESFEGIQVLEARYTARRMSDAWVQKEVLAHCPNLTIDRVYRSEAGILNSNTSPGFDEKPIAEREAIADHYYQATANMEFYDLSAYLGEGVWGYLAEGLLPRCKKESKSSSCGDELKDRYSGGIGAVFDAKQCKILSNVHVRKQRIGQGVIFGRPRKSYYRENPNFLAFVLVEGKPYRIEFDGPPEWRMKDLIQPGFAELFINPLFDALPEQAGMGQMCYFAAVNHPVHKQ